MAEFKHSGEVLAMVLGVNRVQKPSAVAKERLGSVGILSPGAGNSSIGDFVVLSLDKMPSVTFSLVTDEF